MATVAGTGIVYFTVCENNTCVPTTSCETIHVVVYHLMVETIDTHSTATDGATIVFCSLVVTKEIVAFHHRSITLTKRQGAETLEEGVITNSVTATLHRYYLRVTVAVVEEVVLHHSISRLLGKVAHTDTYRFLLVLLSRTVVAEDVMVYAVML